MPRQIQDYGEFLESQAGDDPVSVECPDCEGRGRVYFVALGKRSTCPRCKGRGQILNPDLE